jgi:hypothetical protein
MPHDCPRFDHCNAPICPVDDWVRGHHVKGEPVCFYLREAAKHGGTLPEPPPASSISSVAKKLRSGWPNKYAITRCCVVENSASARLVRFGASRGRGFALVPMLGILVPNMGMFKSIVE